MKTLKQVLQQIGKALEFSNQVGSPTGLHQLLAKQGLQACAASAGVEENVVQINSKKNRESVALPPLVCVR